MSESQETVANPEEQKSAGMPLFYENPVPISFERHGKKHLARRVDARFAAKSNAIPINLSEFAQISRHYPIAFVAAAVPFPVAVVGMRNGENLFVDKKGEWAKNVYVPAYVRRYPFILSTTPDSDVLTLCVDEADGVLSDTDGLTFFEEDGTPSDHAKAALDFCRAYHGAVGPTQDFVKALSDKGLLIERQANVAKKDGQNFNLTGFQVVDAEKAQRLSKDELGEWWGKGWLQAITAHQISMLNWGDLAERV
jgi:hypothetical protein